LADLTTESSDGVSMTGHASGSSIAGEPASHGVFEERLRLALEAGEMGAWEYQVPERRVLWSETLERIHGLDPGTFGGTFDDYQRDIHPDDRAHVFETLTHTLAGEPHRLRYRIIRPDGAVRWVEARGTLIKDANGEPHRISGICMDVTERVQAEAALAAHRAELEAQTKALGVLNEQLRHANEELRLSRESAEAAEHYVSGVLSAITDPLVINDREWRYRYVNDAASRALAPTHGDGRGVLGRILWEAYPDLVGTRFEREMRRVQEEGVPVTFQELYVKRATWSEQRCYPLADGGVLTIWKDITEEKRAAERAHYLSRASVILASSLDYTTSVAQLAQLLVPQLADWCGVQLLDENGLLRQLAVAHVDPVKIQWARAINERYPVDMSAPTGVPNVLRTGKTEMYVDISDEMLQHAAVDDDHLGMLRELGMTSVLIVPLKARGRVIGAMSLISAESGRVYADAEQSLAEQLAERAAIAIDNARLYTETEAGRRALEESQEELAQTNEELSQINEELAQTNEELAQTNEELSQTNEELELTNEELAEKTLLAEQSRAEADKANRSKADFLAHMSHELRTPLNAIAGYSELMEMGLHGPLTPEQTEDLRRIKRSQRHLLSLINDVLNFAKLEAAHVSYDIKPVRIRDAVLALETLIAPQVAAKQLHYETMEIDPNVFAHGDAEKIQQILLNLLSNAVKFTDAGGRIAVGADRVGNVVCIEVSDTGCGIPADKKESVFEPFVQLERTLSSPHQGTGLGLAISRDLARGMGGELTLESTPGSGSRFQLRLPASDAKRDG
jgi:PAS domain S-box-containing protein